MDGELAFHGVRTHLLSAQFLSVVINVIKIILVTVFQHFFAIANNGQLTWNFPSPMTARAYCASKSF